MKQLDESLEKKPTPKDVAMLAEARIRNLLAFDELQSYNDKGRFLFRHPLLRHRSELEILRSLLKRDPEKFLQKHKNVADNIKRYRSYLKREDRKNRREEDKAALASYREKEKLFQEVLENNK